MQPLTSVPKEQSISQVSADSPNPIQMSLVKLESIKSIVKSWERQGGASFRNQWNPELFFSSRGFSCWFHSLLIHFSHWPQHSENQASLFQIPFEKSHKRTVFSLAWIMCPTFWAGGQVLLAYDEEKGWTDKSSGCPLQFPAVTAHVYTVTGPWTVLSGYSGHKKHKIWVQSRKYPRFLHLCSILRDSWVLSQAGMNLYNWVIFLQNTLSGQFVLSKQIVSGGYRMTKSHRYRLQVNVPSLIPDQCREQLCHEEHLWSFVAFILTSTNSVSLTLETSNFQKWWQREKNGRCWSN